MSTSERSRTQSANFRGPSPDQPKTMALGNVSTGGAPGHRGRPAVDLVVKLLDHGSFVHHLISQKAKQASRPVPASRETEEVRILVDETSRATAVPKLGMVHQVDQKGDVRLHAADAELLQATLHPADRFGEPKAPGRDLHQERVVERGHRGPGKGGPGIQPDARPGRRPVVENASVVGDERVSPDPPS